MVVACYADDPKEPELIGETTVDLTEVLTKGEMDGVFHHMYSCSIRSQTLALQSGLHF